MGLHCSVASFFALPQKPQLDVSKTVGRSIGQRPGVQSGTCQPGPSLPMSRQIGQIPHSSFINACISKPSSCRWMSWVPSLPSNFLFLHTLYCDHKFFGHGEEETTTLCRHSTYSWRPPRKLSLCCSVEFTITFRDVV